MSTHFSAARIVAIALAAVGAAIGVIALFVDYWHFTDPAYGYSMIDRTHGVSFVIGNSFLFEAAAIAGVAIASLFWRSAILWAFAAAFAVALFTAWMGYLLAPGINDVYFGRPTTEWGCYLGAGAALLALAGSLLGLRDAFSARVADGVVAVAATAPPASGAVPPPGWFPDPAGGGGQRRWDGRAWTNETSAGAPA
jgi:hypothetical protein